MKNPARWYLLALALGALPLWAGRHLPLVDLPQHLHLISVLHRLTDPTTLYPRLFAARNVLTPYLGYYYAVSWLSWLLPLELANRLFLSAYVVLLPLSVAFLLRSLGRPRWPSLLALPFAYGDSLAWGFINYCVSLPLAFFSLGLFVRALGDVRGRRRWSAWLSVALVGVLLFHIQSYLFVGLSMLWLLLLTRTPDPRPRAWGWPLLATVPSLILTALWVLLRLDAPSEVLPGAPWKAWGPLLSAQNLGFLSTQENLARLLPLLGNWLRDGSDLWAVEAALLVAALGWALWVGVPAARASSRESRLERWRLPFLALVAAALYFTLPFDIRGYLYYLNPRYAPVLAALTVASVPPLTRAWRARLLTLGVAIAALCSGVLARGVHAFQAECEPLETLTRRVPPRSLVAGLIYDSGSRVVTHPVFLHAAADVARAVGGTSQFSFALQLHIPVRYTVRPPQAPVSEWRPDQFRFDTMGSDYDYFLLRGVAPERLWAVPLQRGAVQVVAREGGWSLLQRTDGAPRGTP